MWFKKRKKHIHIYKLTWYVCHMSCSGQWKEISADPNTLYSFMLLILQCQVSHAHSPYMPISKKAFQRILCKQLELNLCTGEHAVRCTPRYALIHAHSATAEEKLICASFYFSFLVYVHFAYLGNHQLPLKRTLIRGVYILLECLYSTIALKTELERFCTHGGRCACM